MSPAAATLCAAGVLFGGLATVGLIFDAVVRCGDHIASTADRYAVALIRITTYRKGKNP